MIILKRDDERVYINSDKVKEVTVKRKKQEVTVAYESGDIITYRYIKGVKFKKGGF